jgi:hypothetical protein
MLLCSLHDASREPHMTPEHVHHLDQIPCFVKRLAHFYQVQEMCYKSIRYKVDQTQKRHMFNVKKPSKAKGKKPRAPASNNLTMFRVVIDRRRFTMR